jgi:hypothetical protein
MTYNILTIGDLHGRDIWKNICTPEYIETNKLNKIVFLGDYVDSFDISYNKQLSNLRDLINFKLKNNNLVELLIGNHDIQYLLTKEKIDLVKCSGFQEKYYSDYHNIFKNYKDLFTIAYQYKNYLFSHAGIHKGWYNYRFIKYVKDHEMISTALNREFRNENEVLFDCGFIRGGRQKVGGILWADKKETSKKPLIGYHQIIGHTIVSEIKTIKIGVDTSLTYLDTQDTQVDFSKIGLLIKIKI